MYKFLQLSVYKLWCSLYSDDMMINLPRKSLRICRTKSSMEIMVCHSPYCHVMGLHSHCCVTNVCRRRVGIL